MTPLDQLERARGGPFTYRHRGEVRGLPDPRALRADVLLRILQTGNTGAMDAPLWKLRALFEAWSAHYDLPGPRQAERLWYLCERYSNVLEVDLRVNAQESLGELWRSRQWRYLLNLIDHLPGHSHYAAAVANDPEHADKLAKALAERAESGEQVDKGPSLILWTPEVRVLADLIDEIKRLRHVIIMANSEKGKAPKAPDPYPRPKSALDGATKRAEHARRQAAHEALAARLLPHKYGPRGKTSD